MKEDHNKLGLNLLLLFLLFFLGACSNDAEKAQKSYELIATYNSICPTYPTYRKAYLPKQILLLKEIVNHLSFKEFKDKKYLGLASLFITLKCENNQEVHIRLSTKAWSFWVKEKPIVWQYKGRLPVWRKYNNPEATKKIFNELLGQISEEQKKENNERAKRKNK